MNGATTEPCAVTIIIATTINVKAKGTSQYLRVVLAYFKIWLRTVSDFIRTDLLD